MNINEEDIIAEFNLADRDPDQQEVQEATGNEGVSMECWYHQAALVIWPQHRHFYQLCQAGQHYAIPQLNEMVQNLVILGVATNSQQWQPCQQFATEIIKEWQIPDHYVHTEDYADSQAMLDLLIKIGKVELLQQFMRTVLTQILSGQENEAIVTVCKQHGWLTFQPELGLMVEQSKNIWAYIQLFEKLCTFEKQQDTERLTLCQTLAPKVLATLQRHGANTRQFSGPTKTPDHQASSLESLFKSLYYIDETQVLTEVVAHFTTANYSLHTGLIPAVKNLATWFASQSHSGAPFQQLLQYCIGELKARTAVPVIMPQNWTQDITLSCTCPDCQELQQFLKQPTEQIYRFRVRKDRRQHLHQQIDKYHCDMTHETERKGSPQTLVCTKNRSSYENRQKQWEIDNELLKELQAIDRRKHIN